MGLTFEEIKNEIRRIIQERQLTSVMNDTKWRHLCEAVNRELPFAPCYSEKALWSVRNEDPPVADTPYADANDQCYKWTLFDDDPTDGLGINAEWIKVAPRRSHHVGQLVEPELQDISERFCEILERLKIPYVSEEGIVTIFGHVDSDGMERLSAQHSERTSTF